MPGIRMSDDFQSEMDVDALKRAEEISSNPKRSARAKRKALEMAREAQEVAQALNDEGEGSAESMLMKGFRSIK